jgi:triphosphatase
MGIHPIEIISPGLPAMSDLVCYNEFMRTKALFEANMHIAEAGRAVFAAELVTIRSHQPALLKDADVTAVHETRKAIRRTFAAFKLFAPYFGPGTLKVYRRGLKKFMRRLGRCRDVAVFLNKLASYAQVHGAIPELADYWQNQKAIHDRKLRHYLSEPKREQFLDAYEEFTETPGCGPRRQRTHLVPYKVKHLAPLLIHERVAAVRAYEDLMAEATIDHLHQLRIQFKELRYTLHFFAPLLGRGIMPIEANLEAIQDMLGDLNDCRVALRLLAVSPVDEVMKASYRAAKEIEIARLVAQFSPLWTEFNAPNWRHKLATALAVI